MRTLDFVEVSFVLCICYVFLQLFDTSAELQGRKRKTFPLLAHKITLTHDMVTNLRSMLRALLVFLLFLSFPEHMHEQKLDTHTHTRTYALKLLTNILLDSKPNHKKEKGLLLLFCMTYA